VSVKNYQAQQEPDNDLKQLLAKALNQSYQDLQQQVQQATNPQQKLGLKNKLNDVHHEISKRTQKQLQAFAKQNPEIKSPDIESDQSLKC
jgi:virulence-associated protein VapD